MGPLRTTLIVLAITLTIAACGRRGPLEPPPAKVSTGEVANPGSVTGEGEGDENLNDRPFILDPLI